MLKKRPKFSNGYKRYSLDPKYKEMVKYGDYTKIAKAHNISLSSVSYAFSSNWGTFDIINSIKSFYERSGSDTTSN